MILTLLTCAVNKLLISSYVQHSISAGLTVSPVGWHRQRWKLQFLVEISENKSEVPRSKYELLNFDFLSVYVSCHQCLPVRLEVSSWQPMRFELRLRYCRRGGGVLVRLAISDNQLARSSKILKRKKKKNTKKQTLYDHCGYVTHLTFIFQLDIAVSLWFSYSSWFSWSLYKLIWWTFASH